MRVLLFDASSAPNAVISTVPSYPAGINVQDYDAVLVEVSVTSPAGSAASTLQLADGELTQAAYAAASTAIAANANLAWQAFAGWGVGVAPGVNGPSLGGIGVPLPQRIAVVLGAFGVQTTGRLRIFGVRR